MEGIYGVLLAGARAHARWEREVAGAIVKSPWRLAALVASGLPGLLLCVAQAGEMLGGSGAYAPSFLTPSIFFAAIGIGFAAGLLTGCIGAGGGFIITPALMTVGVKGILAVGTDLFHIFAKAVMGSVIHRKLGNISVGLAVAFLAGSLAGAAGGGRLNKALYDANPLLSELFISAIYALLLGFLAWFAVWDWRRARKGRDAGAGGAPADGETWAQRIRLAPMIAFDQRLLPGGRRISAWVVAAGGAVVGFLAGIMGVGGGFVTFPMFVHVFGVSTLTTVGTDIFQIVFTAGFAAIAQYAVHGYVFYSLAVGMLLGSLLGIQIGSLTTTFASETHIRGFYALSILAGFLNRAAALPGRLAELGYLNWSAGVTGAIDLAGNVAFWGVVILFSGWVCARFAKGAMRRRRARREGRA